jgi:hypothetical protein
MLERAKPVCATCVFFVHTLSECHAEPPRPAGPAPTGRQASWPVVSVDTFCGRHPELQDVHGKPAIAAHPSPPDLVTQEAIADAVLARLTAQLPAFMAQHVQQHGQPRSGGGGGRRG